MGKGPPERCAFDRAWRSLRLLLGGTIGKVINYSRLSLKSRTFAGDVVSRRWNARLKAAEMNTCLPGAHRRVRALLAEWDAYDSG